MLYNIGFFMFVIVHQSHRFERLLVCRTFPVVNLEMIAIHRAVYCILVAVVINCSLIRLLSSG